MSLPRRRGTRLGAPLTTVFVEIPELVHLTLLIGLVGLTIGSHPVIRLSVQRTNRSNGQLSINFSEESVALVDPRSTCRPTEFSKSDLADSYPAPLGEYRRRHISSYH